jgi:membrane protein
VDSVSNSGTKQAEVLHVAADPAVVPVTQTRWYRLRASGASLISYLLDSEVHTYAFSVAANAILSFIPFVILLYTIAKSVFHSRAMVEVIEALVVDFFPSTASNKFWLGLQFVVPSHIKALSLVMILISCTGIFLPLEVALNQAWGVTKSRNYLMNQVVAFGLAILMVLLGMGAVVLSTAQRQVFNFILPPDHPDNWFYNKLGYVFTQASDLWMLLCTGIACILFFFVIYWLLPNCKVPWRPVLRTSIITGLVWMVAKYIFAAVLPHLDLNNLYGPFFVSVGLLLWAYISGLILFAGAQFSVRSKQNTPEK